MSDKTMVTTNATDKFVTHFPGNKIEKFYKYLIF